MRWCRFESGGETACGIVEDSLITAVDGSPFTAYARTARTYLISAVRLLPPVIPGNFYCGGANYAGHIEKMSKVMGRTLPLPSSPAISYRSNNALIGSGEPIVKPKGAGPNFNYEGELVAVIGRTTRFATRAAAEEAIFGWTIGNDLSERDWQKHDLTPWRAKNSDTFKPMGPWIETDADPAAMQTIIRINGKEVESFKTAGMLFDAVDYICEISQYATLHPGDVIWLGTDGLAQNIGPGDHVDIEITGIGVLSNPVVSAG